MSVVVQQAYTIYKKENNKKKNIIVNNKKIVSIIKYFLFHLSFDLTFLRAFPGNFSFE